MGIRYSLEEVMGSTHWLDDRWAEKESLLAYFSRHQVRESKEFVGVSIGFGSRVVRID